LWRVTSHGRKDVKPWKELGPQLYGEAHCCVVQKGIPSGTSRREGDISWDITAGDVCGAIFGCYAAVRRGEKFCDGCNKEDGG
jgi:hypothetical protein